jgi:hypothetical protein
MVQIMKSEDKMSTLQTLKKTARMTLEKKTRKNKMDWDISRLIKKKGRIRIDNWIKMIVNHIKELKKQMRS